MFETSFWSIRKGPRSPKRKKFHQPSRPHDAALGSDVFAMTPDRNRAPRPFLPVHIVENRTTLGKNGVAIFSYLVDSETQTLLFSVHFESRGYLLPSDSKWAHSELISRARESYEVALKDIPDIETKELNRLIRQDMERATRDTIGRTPLIIILIHRL